MSRRSEKFDKQSKWKGKSKKITTMKKDMDKPTCSHCKKKGHEEARCWKLYRELLLKKVKDKDK